MKLDHIFICVSPGAEEAEILSTFGLAEGTPNIHPGQGTANRRFFFANAFLELLYLHDLEECQNNVTKPTCLLDRLIGKQKAVCPFGIGFRPKVDSERDAPFPSWGYHPVYLPPGEKIQVGIAPLSEPMWFFMTLGGRPDSLPEEKRQPLEHACGCKEITSIRITYPRGAFVSDCIRSVSEVSEIELIERDEYKLEIEFDEARRGKSVSFQPDLPLAFSW